MNAFIALSTILACANAGLIASPYTTLPLANPGVYAAGFHPYAAPVAAPVAPAPVAVAPAPAPPAPVSSQFHSQDELGNINFGYSNINSARQEVGNTYGGVTGAYSYIDANGIPQRVEYIADALGFRVKASNLPVAPVAPGVPEVTPLAAPVFVGEAPLPVEDTPEVKAAKAEFQAAFDEAASRTKRSVAITPAATAPAPALPYAALPYASAIPYATGLPYAFNYPAGYPLNAALPYAAAAPLAAAPAIAAAAPVAYNTPIAAAAPAAVVAGAPAAREAVLTKVKLNPGHAIAYRVD